MDGWCIWLQWAGIVLTFGGICSLYKTPVSPSTEWWVVNWISIKFQFLVNYWINELCFWGWLLFSHAFRKYVIGGKNKARHWWLSSHGATVFTLSVCCLCRLFHPSSFPYRAEWRPYPVLKIELLRVPIGHSDSIVIRPGGSCLQARPDEGLEQYWTPASSQKALHVNTAQPLYSI